MLSGAFGAISPPPTISRYVSSFPDCSHAFPRVPEISWRHGIRAGADTSLALGFRRWPQASGVAGAGLPDVALRVAQAGLWPGASRVPPGGSPWPRPPYAAMGLEGRRLRRCAAADGGGPIRATLNQPHLADWGSRLWVTRTARATVKLRASRPRKRHRSGNWFTAQIAADPGATLTASEIGGARGAEALVSARRSAFVALRGATEAVRGTARSTSASGASAAGSAQRRWASCSLSGARARRRTART